MSRAASRDISAAASLDASARGGLLSTYAVLAKARLSTMVVLTAGAGFLVGSGEAVQWTLLLWTIVGTALAAASAATLNQAIEVRRDGLMHRTRTRPLPQGRLSVRHAALWGAALGVVGVLLLAVLVNPLTALLGGANILIYLFLYTPLKTRSTINTLVGAVCGAIPPVMGWTAATGTLGSGGWVLGGILFIWQIPHFLALAWMYREDYRRGGHRMLPVVDESGRFTGPIVVLYCLALLPVSLLLATLGYAGWIYAGGALLLGVAFLAAAVRLWQRLDEASAKRLFLVSITYIPLLLLLIVLDRTPGVAMTSPVASTSAAPPALNVSSTGSTGPDARFEPPARKAAPADGRTSHTRG
jgi:protoheme IX farnesyltransferase